MTIARSERSRFKLVCLFTLLFGAAAHAYVFFNLTPTHDALYILIATDAEAAWQISIGRFMLPVYWLIRGCYSAPWLIGMLSMAYLVLSAYLVTSVLNIKRTVSLAIICGIFATNMTVTVNLASYLYCADSYLLSLLLACLGVWLWERSPKWGTWGAMPLFALSLGFYQSYIDVAIGLALILILKKAMEGEDLSHMWRRALRYGVSLLGGALLYVVLLKVVLLATHSTLSNGYNSLNSVAETGLLDLIKKIPAVYFNIAAFFLSPLRSYNSIFRISCTALAGVAGVWFWVRAIRRRQVRGWNLAVVLGAAALLPMGLGFIMLFFPRNPFDLMVYSYHLVYVVLLLPLELDGPEPEPALPAGEQRGRWVPKAVAVVCCLTIFSNVVFANGAYFYKDLISRATNEYAFSILEDMERNREYEPGVTPVAVIGDFEESYITRKVDDFARYAHATGLWSAISITYLEVFGAYSRFVYGHPLNLVTDLNELTRLSETEQVQHMPDFPKEGYCAMVDGTMVIRLGEYTLGSGGE